MAVEVVIRALQKVTMLRACDTDLSLSVIVLDVAIGVRVCVNIVGLFYKNVLVFSLVVA
jgi:hypothetical protein